MPDILWSRYRLFAVFLIFPLGDHSELNDQIDRSGQSDQIICLI